MFSASVAWLMTSVALLMIIEDLPCSCSISAHRSGMQENIARAEARLHATARDADQLRSMAREHETLAGDYQKQVREAVEGARAVEGRGGQADREYAALREDNARLAKEIQAKVSGV